MSKQGLFNYGQDIFMAFSPPIVDVWLKKGLQKGGHGHPKTLPGCALDEYTTINTLFMTKMAAKWPKIDTLFMTKTAEKPYPLGPHVPM